MFTTIFAQFNWHLFNLKNRKEDKIKINESKVTRLGSSFLYFFMKLLIIPLLYKMKETAIITPIATE